MNVGGSLDLMENYVKRFAIAPDMEWPLNPKVGRFVFKDRRVYFCVELEGGVPLYVPMTQELDLYRHPQPTPAIEWVINHPLNCTLPLVQVYDAAGKMIFADEVDASVKGTVLVKFNTPQGGFAVIQAGESVGQPKPDIVFEASFGSSTTWTINHGLGYEPVVQCISGGYVVIPDTISHPNTMTTVVTWNSARSGIARCV